MLLREISPEISALIERYNQDELLSDEERLLIEQGLEALSMSFEEKAVSIAELIDSYNRQVEDINNEIDRLKAWIKTPENNAEWLCNYLKNNMISAQIKEIKRPFGGKIHLRPSKRVMIDKNIFDFESDDNILYVRQKIAYEPDKTAIKKALEAGEEILGATLEDNLTLQIK